MRLWTTTEIALLQQLYATNFNTNLGAIFNRSSKSISRKGNELGLRKREGFYEGISKKGKRLNSIRVDKGYYYIKTAANTWVLQSHYIWEQHFGSIPEGMYVSYKDSNPENCTIENLYLISKADLMKRNAYQNYPTELLKTIQLMGVLTRKINQYEKRLQ